MRFSAVIIIMVLLASVIGGVFIFKQEKKIVIENQGGSTPELTPGVSPSTPGVDATTSMENIAAEALILQAEALISEAQKFIKEEKAKSDLIARAREKSSKVKGIYAGRGTNLNYLKQLLDGTELNSLVIDVKEAYGVNLPVSLKNLIKELHDEDVWVIARAVLFRDSSLIDKKPEWYLATTTRPGLVDEAGLREAWQDAAKQYWLDPKNQEVQDYIIEFSKNVIDYGFDEIQFDYIRYPDDYYYVSGEEKIKVIGEFFSKVSENLRSYKPSIILSADLFGYIATQFNSYGTGQRLLDAGKYFDYLSFMLYPSHFYGGFSSMGIYHAYPEVVEYPYDVIYYSLASSRDYLSLFGLEVKIRPWLQDFNLAVDSARGVVYDAQKIRLQIEAAESATSSGWLLWNPSYIYTKEALK